MTAKDAAVCSVRDARTVAEYAARIRTEQRGEMNTLSERMETISEGMENLPERMKFLLDKVPASVGGRRPSRDPGCDRGAGDNSQKRATQETDPHTTHDTARCRHM